MGVRSSCDSLTKKNFTLGHVDRLGRILGRHQIARMRRNHVDKVVAVTDEFGFDRLAADDVLHKYKGAFDLDVPVDARDQSLLHDPTAVRTANSRC